MQKSTQRFILASAVLFSLSAFAAKPGPVPRRIEVTASRFQFEPNQITVKKGEPVVIVLRSTDVTHGLKIPELNISDTANKGRETDIDLTADKVGKFEGKCAHFCGKGHGSMTFTVNVVE